MVIIEILTIFGQTILGLLSALFSVIWNNLPEILEIKKVLGYFTPAGAVAIYLGVPTIVVKKTCKRLRRKLQDWRTEAKYNKNQEVYYGRKHSR